jgi:hypothetical protein
MKLIPIYLACFFFYSCGRDSTPYAGAIPPGVDNNIAMHLDAICEGTVDLRYPDTGCAKHFP